MITQAYDKISEMISIEQQMNAERLYSQTTAPRSPR